MSKLRRHIKKKHSKEPQTKQQIARATTKRLAVMISCVAAVLVLLIFQVGGILWPVWIMHARGGLIALLVFLEIFLIFMSPVIIEANSDPRPLSGPGRNPYYH